MFGPVGLHRFNFVVGVWYHGSNFYDGLFIVHSFDEGFEGSSPDGCFPIEAIIPIDMYMHTCCCGCEDDLLFFLIFGCGPIAFVA